MGGCYCCAAAARVSVVVTWDVREGSEGVRVVDWRAEVATERGSDGNDAVLCPLAGAIVAAGEPNQPTNWPFEASIRICAGHVCVRGYMGIYERLCL